MKWYASSTLLWGYSFPDICERLSEAGFEGLELWAEQYWCEQFTVDIVRDSLAQSGLALSMHAASWDLNLCSLNDGIRAQSIVEIIRSMELAQELGASSLTIHPGRQTVNNHWLPWHMDQLQKSLDELELLAKQWNVTLSIELMESIRKEFITTPALLNELVAHRSDHIRTTFDVAHIDLNESPVEWMQAQHRIDKIHLSDSTPTTYHVPLGEGNIAMEPVLYALSSCDVPIVIEGLDFLEKNHTLQRNIDYLQEHRLLQKARIPV